MRVEFATDAAGFSEAAFRAAFDPIAREFQMNWRIEFADAQQNVALFVSQYLHCLADLLLRHQTGEFRCNLALIVSNHEAARPLADFHKVPFHYMPVTRDNKTKVEAAQLALLAKHKIDLIVLARYMQVLSPKFVAAYPRRIINVHHSFLPAFTGAKPYHAAFERGVKLIGATSHYVTETLDEGPIIEQDVTRISQNDQLPSLIQKGRDLERIFPGASCSGTSNTASSATPTRPSSSPESSCAEFVCRLQFAHNSILSTPHPQPRARPAHADHGNPERDA